jgi:hypothetical protein
VPSLNRFAAVGALAAAVAVAVSISACGSGGSSSSGTTGSSALAGKSADQIVQKSVSDLKAASSVRITGTVNNNGQGITLNLTDVAAQGCQGTIGLTASATATGSAAMSGTASLVVVGSTVYMKLDQSFFKNLGLPESIFADVTGKYIKLTAKSDLASFAQLCDPSNLSSSFAKEDTGFVKSGTATIGGQPALAFTQPKHAGSGTVYISDSATPEIVRIAGTGSQGSIDFSDYNAHATVTAPPASQVVDGSKFGL